MITQQLLDYIHSQQAAGKSMDEIRGALQAAGWQHEHIEEGLRAVQSGQTAAPSAPGAEGGIPKASEILKEAWALYKRMFGTLAGLTAIPIVGFFIIGIGVGLGGLMNGKGEFNFNNPLVTGIGGVLFLIMLIISLWATIAELVAIRDRHESIGIGEAFARSRKFLLPFILTALLVSLAVIGGIILLIIPGIIFALWFSQTSYIVVSENLSGAEAMKRSKAYVKGRIGVIFGKLFYVGLITIAISIAASIVGAVLGNQIISSIINQIVNVLWSPVIAIFGFLLYEHIKRTRPQ